MWTVSTLVALYPALNASYYSPTSNSSPERYDDTLRSTWSQLFRRNHLPFTAVYATGARCCAFVLRVSLVCYTCCCAPRYNSTSCARVVSKTDSEKLSVCLSVCPSDKGHSMVTYVRTNFFRNGYAHAARIRSKLSRRRLPWSKPHFFGCPVYGVIRVDFQHPNRIDGSSSGNRSREGSGKTLQAYFQVELGKNCFCTTAVVLQAISGTAIRSNGHLRTISFEPATPMPGRSPRGGSVSLSIPLLLPPILPVFLAPCRQPPPPCFLVTYLVPGTW